MPIRFRLAALSLWVGGLSTLILTGLTLATSDQWDGVALDLLGADNEGWSAVANVLILYGLAALHHNQKSMYGRLGRVGFLLVFTAYSLPVLGRAGLFFHPEHPIWNLGALASLAGVLIAVSGWVVWGIASYRAKSLPTWATPVPFVIASVWVIARFFLSDLLFDLFWLGDLGLVGAVNAVGLGVLGLFLWKAHSASPPGQVPPRLDLRGA